MGIDNTNDSAMMGTPTMEVDMGTVIAIGCMMASPAAFLLILRYAR